MFRATAGLDRALRRRSRAGHAAGREHDRRHVRRHGGARHEAGRRNSVHGLSLSGDRSDRESHEPPATSHARPPDLSGRDSHAAWRRHSRAGASFRIRRIDDRAHSRHSRRVPLLARRAPTVCCSRRFAIPIRCCSLSPCASIVWSNRKSPTTASALPLDVCYILREGEDVTIVTWGAMTIDVLQAAEQLARDGISAEVIDLATISPIDAETILESVAQDRPTGDRARSGAQLRCRRRNRGASSPSTVCYDLVAPIQRVTGFDTVMPLYRLENEYIPSIARIVDAVKATMELPMTTFNLPDLGEGLPEAEIVAWHVAEGDARRRSISRCCRSKPRRPSSTCRARTPGRSSNCTRKSGDTVQTGTAAGRVRARRRQRRCCAPSPGTRQQWPVGRARHGRRPHGVERRRVRRSRHRRQRASCAAPNASARRRRFACSRSDSTLR